MSTPLPPRGRGTATNLHNRFAPTVSVAEDDGWYQEVPQTQGTEVRIETAKTIITRNSSPDIPFDRAINPYRGCEHGCIYSTICTDTVARGKLLRLNLKYGYFVFGRDRNIVGWRGAGGYP